MYLACVLSISNIQEHTDVYRKYEGVVLGYPDIGASHYYDIDETRRKSMSLSRIEFCVVLAEILKS